MYSILHISDLHRSTTEPVDNDSLIAALMADRDRYVRETPDVPSPNAIIVSGDLIQGAPIGEKDWKSVMGEQYAVAGDFLDKLTMRFLGGDRSKIILVPGNHDVCWNTSHGSMRLVDKVNYPKNLRESLIRPDSLFRWSWKEQALYKIEDSAMYQSRLDAYWTFVDKFYKDTNLIIPIDRERDYQLFELSNRKIIVGAFNSTVGNDCFRFPGALASGVIGRCNLNLRDIDHLYELKIAVWHHSIQGPPMREDYMEIGHVHEMIGLGFQLGLHGHQHVAAANSHYIHLNKSTAMAVVSAGSLCAGARELPRGVDRQYNVIVLDDDLRKARIHPREMTDGGQFTRKSNGLFIQGYVEVDWQPNIDTAGRCIDASAVNERKAILTAEQALQSGDYEQASEILKNIPLSTGSFARILAVKVELKREDWSALIKIIGQPQNIEEAVYLITALIKVKEFDRASNIIIERDDIDQATRKLLSDEIEMKRLLNIA